MVDKVLTLPREKDTNKPLGLLAGGFVSSATPPPARSFSSSRKLEAR
jgi:hypothetical protein